MKSFMMLIFFIRACLCTTYDEDYYESEDDISDKKGFASSDITENIDLFDSATDMIVTDSTTTTVPPHLPTSFTTSTVWPKRITSFSTPTTTTVWPNRTTSCSTPSHNTTTTDTTTTDTTTDTTTEIGRIDFY